MKLDASLAAFVAVVFLLSTTTGNGQSASVNITLNSSGSFNGSFNQAGSASDPYWSDGLAPHPGADYTASHLTLFTSDVAGDATFAGDSLTLTDDASLAVKTPQNPTITIKHLVLAQGSISTSFQFTLAGSITLASGANSLFTYEGVTGGANPRDGVGATISAIITGDGGLDIRSHGSISADGSEPASSDQVANGTRDSYGIILTGNNDYKGNTTVNDRSNLVVNNTDGSATGGGSVIVLSNGLLGGGSGKANGGHLADSAPGVTASSFSTYAPGLKGMIGGQGATINSGGILSPGVADISGFYGNGGVGTLTLTSLTLVPGSIMNYEFGSTANDFVAVTTLDGLTIKGGGFNLYTEGSTAPFATAGIYNLISYKGTLNGNISNLSVLNPQPGYTYTFLTDAINGVIQLRIDSNSK